MKKIKILLLLSLLLIITFPPLSYAASFRSNNDRITINAGETINEDLYIAGGEVIINGTINGDLFVTGGTVSLNGTVADDVFVLSGRLSINGTINDDLRSIGGNTEINGRIRGDFLSLGGDVKITDRGRIDGRSYISSGKVSISGQIQNINISAAEIEIRNTARIGGDVNYISTNEPSIEDGAIIGGIINRHETGGMARQFAVIAAAFHILSFIVAIIIALIFIYFFPIASQTMAINWKNNFGINLLWGFIFIITFPIAALMLIVSILGFPLGIGALLIYPILLYIARVITIISIGYWFMGLYKNGAKKSLTWLTPIIGAIIYQLLFIIPFVGWLIIFIIFLTSLGALTRYLWLTTLTLKKKKII
jgi:cytoskeletal protein CcmA (bactofilin family)